MATAKESPITIDDAIREPGTGVLDPREATYLLLRLSPEMDRTIEDLMDRTGLSKADVLNMAVGFLKMASDATAEGKRVGIAGEDQELEVEITGL